MNVKIPLFILQKKKSIISISYSIYMQSFIPLNLHLVSPSNILITTLTYLRIFCILNLLFMAGQSNIKIMSLNCRGLGNWQKRKDVFNHIRDKKFSIYCLQDTHFTEKDKSTIRSTWGFEIYMSAGKSDARGVAILFNNNFEFKVHFFV